MATAARLHTFLVIKCPGQPDRILVWDTQDLTVGRSSESDLVLEHGELSRRHAIFAKNGPACLVKNLSTSNPTFVNGAPIETHRLQSKDAVRLADSELIFYQVAKNPVTLGPKVEYVSQLKSFGAAGGASANPEATMLGLVETVEADDDFEVRPAGDFAYDLHEMEDLGRGQAPRNLDLEIDGPDLEPIETPARDESWSLEELPEASAAAGGRLSLHLEVEGLSAELEGALRGLLGKTVKLPALRLRLKADDLG